MDNNLTTDFTAGNVFNVGINTTSTYVWVGGLVLLSLGLEVLATDSSRGPFRTSSFVLSGALLAGGVLDLWAPAAVLTAVYLGLAVAALYWIVTALRHLGGAAPNDVSAGTPNDL